MILDPHDLRKQLRPAEQLACLRAADEDDHHWLLHLNPDPPREGKHFARLQRVIVHPDLLEAAPDRRSVLTRNPDTYSVTGKYVDLPLWIEELPQ